MTILIATGLRREARIMARAGVTAIAGGGDGARLERMLEAAIAAGGVRAILSSGLAGALDPALGPGDLVIGEEGDTRLVAALRHALPDAAVGRVIGGDVMVASVEAKRALREETGAIAVEMEGHVAARVAARHGLPFATLRAISDAADHALPPAALAGMRPDGGMAVGAVLASLIRRPGQLPALIRTARGAQRGFRALLRGHRVLGIVDLVQHALDMP